MQVQIIHWSYDNVFLTLISFLFDFWRRFDDIFKKLEEHDKIFELLKKRNKNRIITNEILKNSIYSRKLSSPKTIIKRQTKIDVYING